MEEPHQSFPHYTFQQCREIAEAAREDTWPMPLKGIPVDILKIVECRIKPDGIRVIPIHGLRSSCDVHAFLSQDRKSITVDHELYFEEKFLFKLRYDFAHELGHYFLHRDFYEANKFANPEEWLSLLARIDPDNHSFAEAHADEFAGRFLVPVPALNAEIEKLHDYLAKVHDTCLDENVDEETEETMLRYAVSNKLDSKFQVAPEIIERRLKMEGINVAATIWDVIHAPITLRKKKD